jgi:hypothetical protein
MLVVPLSRVSAAVQVDTVSCPLLLQTEAAVTLGGQTMQLLVDTGSSTLVVASTLCTGCTRLSERGLLWNVSHGATSDVHVSGGYGFGGNSWNGTVYTATAGLGDAVVTGFRFAALTAEQGRAPIDTSSPSADACTAGSAVRTGNQGILGLGPPALTLDGTDGWLTKYFDQHSDVPRAFSLTQCASGGHLVLGVTAAPDAYVLTPTTRQTRPYSWFYNVPLSLVGVHGGPLRPVPGDVVLDSGTNFNYLPAAAVRDVWAVVDPILYSLGSSDAYTESSASGAFSCADTVLTADQLNAQLPSMDFVIGGYLLRVPAVGAYLSVVASTATSQTVCKTLLPSTGSLSFLGWPFQSAFVVTVNTSNARGAQGVGFTALSSSTCHTSTLGGAGGGGIISAYVAPPPMPPQPPSPIQMLSSVDTSVLTVVVAVISGSLVVAVVFVYSALMRRPRKTTE